MFTPLSMQEIKEIVGLQFKGITKLLTQQGIVIDATDQAIELLAKKGYDPQYGARPVKRVIQKEVLNELSKQILSGKIAADSIVLVDAFENELVFRNQTGSV
jgi:ATP-dependent Clp protease ATP-binding subunit ClpB